MRHLIRLLMLSGVALASGCVVVPAQQAGIGFYGPFPAVFVESHQRHYERRDYDDRDSDRGRYDDDGRYDERSRKHHRDQD